MMKWPSEKTVNLMLVAKHITRILLIVIKAPQVVCFLLKRFYAIYWLRIIDKCVMDSLEG